MSAAKAICDHLRDWFNGTPEGVYVSMGVSSDGSYGIEKGLIYSFPVRINKDQSYTIVNNLPIDDFSREKLDATANELIEEKNAAMETCEQ